MSSSTSPRPRVRKTSSVEAQVPSEDVHLTSSYRGSSWRRIVLLIVAITVHNIPEGLAVGVGFGAIGKSVTATFENARCSEGAQLVFSPLCKGPLLCELP